MLSNRIFLALVVSMIFPAGASAVVVGPDLTAPDVSTNTTNLSYVPFLNADTTEYTGTPISGVLTKVRVQAGGLVDTHGVATVMRRQTDWVTLGANFTKIGEVPFNVSADPSTAGHITEVPARVTVNAGDYFGLDNSDSNLRIFQSFGSGPTDYCAYSGGFPAVGDTATYSQVGCNRSFPLVQAVVEPDADADGFGDETQDACPTDASRQTACLAPANIVLKAMKSSSKAASSASRSFTLTNTGQVAAALVPFSIKASKPVKNLRIVKGCKPVSKKKPRSCTIASIAAGAKVTIKVSLSIKAATKTTLTATSGSLTAKSTVKLKAKKK